MLNVTEIYEDLTSQLTPQKVIRLIAIVGGYVVFRRIAMNEIKRRQLKNMQSEESNGDVTELPEVAEEKATSSAIESNDQTWGWGKKTRRNVNKQREIFEQAVEESAKKHEEGAYDADSDKDIEELLED